MSPTASRISLNDCSRELSRKSILSLVQTFHRRLCSPWNDGFLMFLASHGGTFCFGSDTARMSVVEPLNDDIYRPTNMDIWHCSILVSDLLSFFLVARHEAENSSRKGMTKMVCNSLHIHECDLISCSILPLYSREL